MRRSNAAILASRQRDWQTLRGEGVNLFTMCLACGEIAHCRGKTRETVRCEPCFTCGPNGARIIYTVLHELRSEVTT